MKGWQNERWREKTADIKTTIDFSCKHHILIRNEDGTYSHMDEPYYRAKQVAPGTWQILSSGDYSYLLEGENEAIAIDTGYGAGNIRDYLQTAEGIDKATVPYQSFEGISFIQDYIRIPVEEGFLYDLGGRTLEVFSIPDHTPDGIALLDRKERLLFTGDEFMMVGKTLKVSVTVFHEYLEKLLAHRREFDRLCGGGGVYEASFLDHFYECTKMILAGNKGKRILVEGRGIPELPKGPNGEIVYDRMQPHPGDGGAGKADFKRECYIQEYEDAKLLYEEI